MLGVVENDEVNEGGEQSLGGGVVTTPRGRHGDDICVRVILRLLQFECQILLTGQILQLLQGEHEMEKPTQ